MTCCNYMYYGVFQIVGQISWHCRGDYLAVTCSDGEASLSVGSSFQLHVCSVIHVVDHLIFALSAKGSDVIIHQLSKARSQVSAF